MKPADAAKILAIAAAYDKRTVGETDALAWADALADLDPRECADAVRTHYRATDTWIMPSHVRVIVAGQHREAAEQRRTQRVLRELEAARAQASPQTVAEAKAAFADALAARKADHA